MRGLRVTVVLLACGLAGACQWVRAFSTTDDDSAIRDQGGRELRSGDGWDRDGRPDRAPTDGRTDRRLSDGAGPGPQHVWSQRFGGVFDDGGQAVALDASGNVYVTGHFQASVNFGGGALISAGSGDVFLASFTPAGAHRWSKRFGGAVADYGHGVAVDASGNVYVAGCFQAAADFGAGTVSSAGLNDAFLASYTSTGTYRWSKTFGGSGGDDAFAVATDASGNPFITGNFAGTVSFGGTPFYSAGESDIFVASFSSLGSHRWARASGGAIGDIGYDVASDSSGNIYVTGYFQGTASFGGASLISAGSSDIFLASYSSLGAHLWSRRMGGTSMDMGRGVAVDATGSACITGGFTDAGDFGGGTITAAGKTDAFVARYTASSGQHVWSKRLGGIETDMGLDVGHDPTGNVYVIGYFSGATDFGGGALTSAGGYDVFIASYAAAAKHRWSVRFGDASGDTGYGLALGSSNRMLVTGEFEKTVSFGAGSLVSAGGDDAFVLSLTP